MDNASTLLHESLVNAQHGAATVQAKATGFVSQFTGGLSAWTLLLSLLFGAIIYDQANYIIQKGRIAGDPLKLPFIGPFLESIYPDFEKYKAKWNSGALSCVSVFHKFVVIASTRDMARKAFNSPSFIKPCVVDVAHKILRPNNWVFLDGKAHVEYRKGLNGLFTRQALDIYLPRQVEVYDTYFNKFVDISQKDFGGKPTPFMPYFRELMCAVSCRTFVGYYMPDDAMKKIADDYYKITAALDLVNFPIILPFTRPWYGRKAADVVLEEFAKCAAKSKVRMAAGGSVGCILDAWVKNMLDSKAYREQLEKGIPKEEIDNKPEMVLRDFSDEEIAMTLLTFLFASQDATSSACTWLFQLMAGRPEILNRLREENIKARNGDIHAPLSVNLLDSLTYTRAVVKETLRYRPPVIMVPYVAKKDYPITDTYTAPKGSMVVPSTYPALHDPEAYPEPEEFDPERWISGTAEQQTKNWLVFGTGPHHCIGQTYATFNLMTLIGKASLELDWRHYPTSLSEKVKVFATIFPMDDCPLTFEKRVV